MFVKNFNIVFVFAGVCLFFPIRSFSDSSPISATLHASVQTSIDREKLNVDAKGSEQKFLRLSERAKKGDTEAQYGLGEMYLNGMPGLAKDRKEAFKWFLRAAEKGDADSQFTVGCLYCKGDGVAENKSVGLKWIFKAAAKENAKAAFLLGDLYFNGEGVDKDVSKAISWFRKAVGLGDKYAANCLAGIYFAGKGVDADDEKAYEYLKKGIKKGFNAANIIGSWYERGLQTSQNYAKAVKWYKRAVAENSDAARLNLSRCYNRGLGVDVDKKRAFELCETAAKHGVANAEFLLGSFYAKGTGVEKNLKKGIVWIKKASDHGVGQASFTLGKAYYNGEQVKRNYAKALKYFKRATNVGGAWKGIPEFCLGQIYYYGQGAPRDNAKALEWFEKSAAKNYPKAFRKLAEMYKFGLGVRQNEFKALQNFKKAADWGDRTSMRKVAIESFWGKPRDLSNVIVYGEKYAADRANCDKPKKFKGRLDEELMEELVLLAYMAKGKENAVYPFVKKFDFPVYSFLIMLCLLSPFVMILLGIAVWRYFKKSESSTYPKEWSISDGMCCLTLFYVLSVVFWSFLFIQFPFITIAVKMIVLQALAGVATVILYVKIAKSRGWSIKEKFSLKSVPFGRCLIWGLGGCAVSFSFNIAYENILNWLHIAPMEQFIQNILIKGGGKTLLSMILCVLCIGVVIPVVEEFVFRVIIYQGLKSKVPVWAAMILSSLIFAFSHIQISTMLPLFFMGMVFSYSYEKSKSIYVPIAIHVTNNLIAYLCFAFLNGGGG